METQKAMNSQSNLEGKTAEESGSLTSDYTIKLRESRQCGTATKTEIQINGKGQKVQRKIFSEKKHSTLEIKALNPLKRDGEDKAKSLLLSCFPPVQCDPLGYFYSHYSHLFNANLLTMH